MEGEQKLLKKGGAVISCLFSAVVSGRALWCALQKALYFYPRGLLKRWWSIRMSKRNGISLLLHCDADTAVLIPPVLTVVSFAEAKDPRYYFHLHQQSRESRGGRPRRQTPKFPQCWGRVLTLAWKPLRWFTQHMKPGHESQPMISPSFAEKPDWHEMMKTIALFFHKTWNEGIKFSHCVFFQQMKPGHPFKWVWNVPNLSKIEARGKMIRLDD